MKNKGLTVAFDIDNCLVDADYNPRDDVIDLFHIFEKLGCRMVIWSDDSVKYTEHWAKKLGLNAILAYKTYDIRADITFDDQDISLGKVNIQV